MHIWTCESLYYVLKSKNFFSLIIEVNNIHKLNILRFNIRVFFKKMSSTLYWHTLTYLENFNVAQNQQFGKSFDFKVNPMGNTMHFKHERACFSLSYVVTFVLVAPFKIETLFTSKLMSLEARYSPSMIEVSHLKTKETMKTSQIYIFFHKPKIDFPFLFHFKQNKSPLNFV